MKNRPNSNRDSFDVVTGAFGYSGSYIAKELLRSGRAVRTLSNRDGSNHELFDRVESRPLDFTNPDGITESLRGASVLYNTYWVRFSKAGFSQAEAVLNTKRLFECARAAGVKRIVHVSITHPSKDSPYEYFRCKAEMEQALVRSGVPHTILRPAVLFGGDDILINNIAWSLRRLPVFGVFGDGSYSLQPIHVEDFARLAVQSSQVEGNQIVQAVGSEVWSYRELVKGLARVMGIRRLVIGMPKVAGLLAAKCIGAWKDDVTLTSEEVGALMDGLLATDSRPDCGDSAVLRNPLGKWMEENADRLGKAYANELLRRA